MAIGIVVALAASCTPLASKGTMPPPGRNGAPDASAAPDFIAVAGPDGGIAGYVPKAYLFPDASAANGRPGPTDVPVYGEDVRTLVGHMVAGRGFVPLGVDPLTVATFRAQTAPSPIAAPTGSTDVTLYVRNATAGQAWFAVHDVGAQGYGNGRGVGCFHLVVGEELVMFDRAPGDAGARPLRVLFGRTQAVGRPVLWVDIAADGSISQGAGVPAWWHGEPQAC